ncbi:hypothetical protein Tco_0836700 [Tanacetum coccineum]
MLAVCASRAAVIPSVISCRMAASVMVGAADVDVFLGGIYRIRIYKFFEELVHFPVVCEVIHIEFLALRDRLIKEIVGGCVVVLTGDEDPTDEVGETRYG